MIVRSLAQKQKKRHIFLLGHRPAPPEQPSSTTTDDRERQHKEKKQKLKYHSTKAETRPASLDEGEVLGEVLLRVVVGLGAGWAVLLARVHGELLDVPVENLGYARRLSDRKSVV